MKFTPWTDKGDIYLSQYVCIEKEINRIEYPVIIKPLKKIRIRKEITQIWSMTVNYKILNNFTLRCGGEVVHHHCFFSVEWEAFASTMKC